MFRLHSNPGKPESLSPSDLKGGPLQLLFASELLIRVLEKVAGGSQSPLFLRDKSIALKWDVNKLVIQECREPSVWMVGVNCLPLHFCRQTFLSNLPVAK